MLSSSRYVGSSGDLAERFEPKACWIRGRFTCLKSSRGSMDKQRDMGFMFFFFNGILWHFMARIWRVLKNILVFFDISGHVLNVERAVQCDI